MKTRNSEGVLKTLLIIPQSIMEIFTPFIALHDILTEMFNPFFPILLILLCIGGYIASFFFYKPAFWGITGLYLLVALIRGIYKTVTEDTTSLFYIYDSNFGSGKTETGTKGDFKTESSDNNNIHSNKTDEEDEEFTDEDMREVMIECIEHAFDGMTPDQAKACYKELLNTYHPDNQETGDDEICKLVTEKYREYKETQ